MNRLYLTASALLVYGHPFAVCAAVAAIFDWLGTGTFERNMFLAMFGWFFVAGLNQILKICEESSSVGGNPIPMTGWVYYILSMVGLSGVVVLVWLLSMPFFDFDLLTYITYTIGAIHVMAGLYRHIEQSNETFT